MNSNNLQDLCRACLTYSDELIDLQCKLDEILEENIHLVHQAMGRVLKKDIVLNDLYPMYLCRVCYSVLNLAYKFVVDCERTENILNKRLNLFKETNENEASVELISSDGKFDVKELLIVEEVDDEANDFDGFLRNLGTEISAVFVENSLKETKIKEPTDYNVTLTQVGVKEKSRKKTDLMEMEDSSQILNLKNQCDICDKVFKRKSYLQRHIKQVHINADTYLCPECGYLAKSQVTLRYHIHAKHGERKYQCEHCEKRFIALNHLQTHLLAHTNKKAYLCNVCGKSFNYSNSLEYHMRIHTGEKRYECKYCLKKFAVSSARNRHVLSHTGLRPHKCRHCERAFRSTGERNCHERLHTGERPYHCKHCGKRFIKNYNLKVHLLNHKGKYRCSVCNKSFIEIDYLKTHLKTVHNVELSEANKNLN